jgi:MFS family permease
VTTGVAPRGLGARFGLLWAGQSASLLGDQVTLIALPLLALGAAAATPVQIGVLGACLRLPFLLIGLPAGVWVSRAGLSRSMIGADLLRGLAVAALPVAALAGAAHFGVLVAAALAVGTGTVFFQVAYQSLVPDLVPDPARWAAANTRLSLSESVALLAGPAAGGLVVTWLAPPGALLLDAASYAVSVGTLLLAARRAPRPAPVPRRPLLREVRAGLRYVRGQPVLNAIMWVGGWYNLGSAVYDALLVLFAVRVLHLSPAHLGLAVGIGGIGFPLGSLLAGRVTARLGEGRALIAAAVPSVGGLLVGAAAAGPRPEVFLAAGTFLVGLGQGCFAVNAITLRQRAAAPELRAQATAVHRFVSWGALPLGSALAGVLAQLLGVRAAVLLAGVLAAGCFHPLLTCPDLRRRA